MFHQKGNVYVEKSRQIQDGRQKPIKLCITLHDCVQDYLNAYILNLGSAVLDSHECEVFHQRGNVTLSNKSKMAAKINIIMYHFT